MLRPPPSTTPVPCYRRPMETKDTSQDSIVTGRLKEVVAAEEAEAVAYKAELMRWLLEAQSAVG